MENFKELIDKINVGKAILFVGAGFSKNCTNYKNNNLPLAKDLAKEICKLGNFSESENLNYASAKYFDENQDAKKLITLLRDILTIKVVSNEVLNICKLIPWYKIYTTNYDNAIEKVLPEFIPLDLNDDVNKYYIYDKRCLHINGYIENLSEKNLNKGFYLSDETSLADIFNKSAWNTIFKSDVDGCSCLVFIGYSLYDFEIKKIIYNLSEKKDIYFVVNSDISEENCYLYSKYGNIIKLGVEGFSKKILEYQENIKTNSINQIKSIRKYEISKEQNQYISDNDLIDMFVFGKVNLSLLEKSILTSNNYIIKRNKIEEIVTNLAESNILITSELGNGKTLFIKSLLPILSKKYKNIFIIDDYNQNILKEIEDICNQIKDEIIIFVIDDYNFYYDILVYLLNFNLSKIRLLLTSRSSKHYKYKQLFIDKKVKLVPYSLDRLDDDEIKSFITLLDLIGFWEKDYFTNDSKINLLKNECNRQLSSILLKIFDSSEIKKRIEEIKNGLFADELLKELTFVSLFVGSIYTKTLKSILHSIIGSAVYNEKNLTNENFNSIFCVTSTEINSFSRVFNQKFIQEFYDSDYTIKKLLFIAKRVSEYSSQDNRYREILKHCLKFSVIERILSENGKRESLIYYYDQIKRNAQWLVNDPHYWLQYGMGFLSFKQYEMTEKYFKYAYNCAKNKRNGYDVENIDTQYARLYFMKAIDETNFEDSFKLFNEGHKRINQVSNSKYKYRQLSFYNDYYQEKYRIFEKSHQNKFFEFCRITKENLSKMNVLDSYDEVLMKRKISELENIMFQIKQHTE